MDSTAPWHNKRVVITGVCGTVGRELLRQLVDYAPATRIADLAAVMIDELAPLSGFDPEQIGRRDHRQ
jgi:FlaA1/EpsC-like NDP-sugar epimerase